MRWPFRHHRAKSRVGSGKPIRIALNELLFFLREKYKVEGILITDDVGYEIAGIGILWNKEMYLASTTFTGIINERINSYLHMGLKYSVFHGDKFSIISFYLNTKIGPVIVAFFTRKPKILEKNILSIIKEISATIENSIA